MTVDHPVPNALDGERLDRAVALIVGCSRSEATALIGAGRVQVDGVVADGRALRLVAGSVLRVDTPDAVDPRPCPDDSVEFGIVHLDDDIVVVDKPAGLVVHPGSGHPDGTLVNGLLARFPEIAEVGQPERPGIVHRLDRGTTGLLVVARTAVAYDALVDDLASHRVVREYHTVAVGRLEPDRGLIDAPVGRSARNATRMAVAASGKDARTRYEVVEHFAEPLTACLVHCRLETGRTHQIRVHLQAVGHPVLGDATYGGVRSEMPMQRPFLHAATLGFVHPRTGELVEFSASLPDDLVEVLARFRSAGDDTGDVNPARGPHRG